MNEPPFASEPDSRHNEIRESQPQLLTEIEYAEELYFNSFIHRRRLYGKHSRLVPLESVRCYLCGYVTDERDNVYQYDGVCSLNKYPRYYCNSCNDNIAVRLPDRVHLPSWASETRMEEFLCLVDGSVQQVRLRDHQALRH